MIAAKQSDLTPAQRAHIRRVLWLMLVYAIVLPPLVWLRATGTSATQLVLIMAIAASMPVLGMLRELGPLSFRRARRISSIALAPPDRHRDQCDDGRRGRVGFPPGVRRDASGRSLLDSLRLGRDAGRERLHRGPLARPPRRLILCLKGIDMVRTPAWKRYNWRVIWLSLLYVAFLLPAVYGFNTSWCLTGRIFRSDPPRACQSSAFSPPSAATWSKSRMSMCAC